MPWYERGLEVPFARCRFFVPDHEPVDPFGCVAQRGLCTASLRQIWDRMNSGDQRLAADLCDLTGSKRSEGAVFELYPHQKLRCHATEEEEEMVMARECFDLVLPQWQQTVAVVLFPLVTVWMVGTWS